MNSTTASAAPSETGELLTSILITYGIVLTAIVACFCLLIYKMRCRRRSTVSEKTSSELKSAAAAVDAAPKPSPSQRRPRRVKRTVEVKCEQLRDEATIPLDDEGSIETVGPVSIGQSHEKSIGSSLDTLAQSNHELAVPGFLEYTTPADFTATRKIASGGESTIYLGRALNPLLIERAKTNKIAIKVTRIDTKDSEMDAELRRIFEQEISLMWFFKDRPYFVELYGYCSNPRCILMKRYPLGSLQSLIIGKEPLDQLLRVYLLLDICLGLYDMHSAGFAHCDVKTANILIDEHPERRYVAVLTDFGISKIFDAKTLLVKGFVEARIEGASIAYAAPEVLAWLQLGTNAVSQPFPELAMSRDIYASAFVMYELLLRKKCDWLFTPEEEQPLNVQ